MIDGHDVSAVLTALDRAKATTGRPQAIIARTIKGHGVSFVAGKEHWHGKPFSKDQLPQALKEMGGAIEVPARSWQIVCADVAAAPARFPGTGPAGLCGRKAMSLRARPTVMRSSGWVR